MAKKEQLDYQDRIVTDPQIMVGKPVVRGTRIPVEHVLGRLAENPDLTELFAAYPELTREDVKACLHYAQTAVGRSVVQRRRRTYELPPRPECRCPSYNNLAHPAWSRCYMRYLARVLQLHRPTAMKRCLPSDAAGTSLPLTRAKRASRPR